MTESGRVDRRAEERDSGLQPERTLLAWSRTALVMTVDAALVLRAGLASHRPELTAVGALLAAAACALYAHGLGRRRRLEHPGRPSEVTSAAPLRATAVLVVVVAVAAGWCVLTSPTEPRLSRPFDAHETAATSGF